MPSEVYIEAPSRLHFGFTEVNREGRPCGSAGVALDNPLLKFTLTSTCTTCCGECSQEIVSFASAFAKKRGVEKAFGADVMEHIPQHVGLGSGTQMCLGAGIASSTLAGNPAKVGDVAEVMGRGIRSKIGILSFKHGRFSMDTSSEQESIGVPGDWRFVIAVPSEQKKIYGVEEKKRLSELQEHDPKEMNRKLAEARVGMLKGLGDKDIRMFGEAVTYMDRLNGEMFKSVQDGIYTNPLVEKGLEIAFEAGALGGGQSSWGPGFFALAEDETFARRMMVKLADFLDSNGGGCVFSSGVRDYGARIWSD